MGLKGLQFARAGILSWLALFFATAWLGMALVRGRTSLRGAFVQVCQKVNSRIYLPASQMANWSRQCRDEAKKVTASDTAEQVAMRFNSLSSQLRVSHLGIFAPEETKRVWSGQYRTTGIQSRYIDGEVVIVDIVSESPAYHAGLRRGDLIKTINGELSQVQDAETEGGVYIIERRGRRLQFEVETAEIQIDEKIQWIPLDSETLLLRVPSFRTEFFEDANWKKKISEFRSSKKVIIDLRENHGGSFVAGLRFLSPFLCEVQTVGRLLKAKRRTSPPVFMANDLSDEAQVELLNQNDEIHLQSFSDFACWKAKKIIVLVGPKTSSTAEIAAQALSENLGAQIMGSTTSGQCLVSIWYPLPAFGKDYLLSIPEAIYQSKKGARLEGEGVKVNTTLYERIEDYVQGHDSLVEQARKKFD